MWISPNYKNSDFNDPLTTEDKILIFIDRTLGWQLKIAYKCINGEIDPEGKVLTKPIPHSGYAALHIVLSYFEMIAKFIDGFTGVGQSRKYFMQGVYSVFPELNKFPRGIVNDLLDTLYFGGRCGLYHGGMTDPRIILTGECDVAMDYDTQVDKLIINPHKLVPVLISHIYAYEVQLRNPANNQLRNNFERRFDFEVRGIE